MTTNSIAPAPSGKFRQIGVSRPPLEVEDLPSPEEVFKVKRIGLEELVLFILGPSLIALGVSIGSGEWLLGPQTISQYGFKGIGWIILISAVLQVFYNVELARFTMATGEAPVVAFGRTPPGYWLWIPLALFSFYLAFILGGWAVQAGTSLFVLTAGRIPSPAETETVRLMSIGLMVTCFFFFIIGKKIERTLEVVQGIFIAFILISLVVVTLVIVPLDYWGQSLAAFITPSAPPAGTDPTLLGAVAGFVALASGLNFMMIGYYRDKGYGMGSRTGYLSGLLGGSRSTTSAAGKTFPEDEKNSRLWKRWFRLLLIDQWGIYFVGALVGMIVPCVLVGYLASLPGASAPTPENLSVYAALQLSQRYGPVMFGWALLISFGVLYTTQMLVLELLARNMTDALFGVSPWFRKAVAGDPRRFYYPFILLLIAIVGLIIHLDIQAISSANLSNLAALFFPLAMIYLNRQLPRPARISWWSYLVLIANVLFFGFFFINFLAVIQTGSPLVRF